MLTCEWPFPIHHWHFKLSVTQNGRGLISVGRGRGSGAYFGWLSPLQVSKYRPEICWVVHITINSMLYYVGCCCHISGAVIRDFFFYFSKSSDVELWAGIDISIKMCKKMLMGVFDVLICQWGYNLDMSTVNCIQHIWKISQIKKSPALHDDLSGMLYISCEIDETWNDFAYWNKKEMPGRKEFWYSRDSWLHFGILDPDHLPSHAVM